MSHSWGASSPVRDRGPGAAVRRYRPHPALLDAWGLPRTAEGLETFAEICVEAFTGEVGLVKPQVAFFEAYGSAGFAVLERTISVLRDAGTLVVADAKRGDIGSTMDAYAQAWLGDSPLASDSVTVSPYLGFGALTPTLELARQNARGIFVLARTSNPEGGVLQQSSTDGVSVLSRSSTLRSMRTSTAVTPSDWWSVQLGTTVWTCRSSTARFSLRDSARRVRRSGSRRHLRGIDRAPAAEHFPRGAQAWSFGIGTSGGSNA